MTAADDYFLPIYYWEQDLSSMKSRLPAPTKAESHRIAWMKNDGCIACRQRGHQRYADAHHLLKGYRISHSHTIPLCEWHHRGINIFPGTPTASIEDALGPSYANSKKAFVEEFGTEEELLEKTDNRYMEENGGMIG